ncbi:hypothetical protein I4U23_023752 [Adineta vaga]|nr:hypothetical protein I4U23_023752 [Adineta vaga]
MLKSSHNQLLILAIVSIFVLLFTIANCNNNHNYHNDRIQAILFGRRIPIDEQIFDDSEQDRSSDEDTNLVTRDLLKPYPNRRSFHAMRGKRRAILP